MAAMGVEAIATLVRTGVKPMPTSGLDFFDTGAVLVTDKPVAGLDSIDAKAGLGKCWG
jgi:fructose transport system substrate-binding protein